MRSGVSVLFSEPKIPQSGAAGESGGTGTRFSALQRAENSSIATTTTTPTPRMSFQCSSASRKFLNSSSSLKSDLLQPRFSALQRAENSSIAPTARMRSSNCVFQCSSASRKFLNSAYRCSLCAASSVSVLFSEPKIPQSPAASV